MLGMNDRHRSMALLRQQIPDGYQIAANVMIIARTERRLFRRVRMNAFVLMQMRFDGYLGFPGGLTGDGEDLLSALNRKLEEELGVSAGFCSQIDFLSQSLDHRKKVASHLFTKTITEEEMLSIERKALACREAQGHKVLGYVRVPLYKMHTTGDDGLPAFLKHNFAGNARKQLLEGLMHHGFIDASSNVIT